MPKKRINSVIKWLFLIMLLLFALVGILLSPFFNIQVVEAKNNKKVLAEEIINLSGIVSGENIFKTLDPNIVKKIKKNPYIEAVDIKREFPAKVVLEVSERIPTYVLKIGGANAYINNQGYILEISTEEIKLPIISGYKTEIGMIIPGNRLILKDLQYLEQIIEIINCAKSNEIKDKILEIGIQEDTLVLKLTDEKIAYIKDNSNLNVKMIQLKGILEAEAGKPGEIFLDGVYGKKAIFFREKM